MHNFLSLLLIILTHRFNPNSSKSIYTEVTGKLWLGTFAVKVCYVVWEHFFTQFKSL